MNILLCHNFYRSKGGEDRCVELLSELLTSKGHTVLPFFKYSRSFEAYGVVKRSMLPFEILYSLSSRSAVRSLVRANLPQLAYIHNLYPFISPSILSILRDHSIPVIMTMHAYKPLCTNGLFFTKGRVCEKCGNGNYIHSIINNCRGSYVESIVYATAFMIHKQIKLIEPYVDIFVTPSEFLKEKLIQYGFMGKKIIVIPNFILMEKNIELKSSGKDYVIYFGRLSAEKGMIALLNAAQLIPHVQIVIVGDGPLRTNVLNHLNEQRLKNVQYLGYLSGNDLWSVIAGAKFTIVPSESYETFPYSAIESFYFGKPVIASRIGGLPEIIEDGINGLLFNPGDAVDLSQKIDDLWTQPDKVAEFGLNAERKAMSQYTPERFYERLLNLFEHLGIKSGDLHSQKCL